MIRHRFGGYLRAVRARTLRRSVTHRMLPWEQDARASPQPRQPGRRDSL